MQTVVLTVLLVLAASAPALADGVQIVGVITNIQYGTGTFVIDGTTVQTNAQTIIRQNGRTISFGDLEDGMTVAVCGTLEGNVLTAKRVTVRTCPQPCPQPIPASRGE